MKKMYNTKHGICGSATVVTFLPVRLMGDNKQGGKAKQLPDNKKK